jgi:3-oxosteroid 1-dehydrogenase
MRLPCRDFMLSNRYSLDLAQSLALSARPAGWQWVVARMFARYWLDLAWRMKTRRDRRATMGNALIGRLFRELNRRGVTVALNVRPSRILSEGGHTTGLEVDVNGERCRLGVRNGLILAAGGFEQSQELRDENLPVETDTKWSLTPPGGNSGELLVAARDIGAATQFLQHCWWAPSMQLPTGTSPDLTVTHQMFFDHRHPHSVVVNRLGKRFVNESCTYDDFGKAMIADQQRSGANLPCWMVFDATYRRRYTCGGIMPSSVVPDRKVPKQWWDTYLYRAPSIAELAEKISVPQSSLENTVAKMNGFAASGKDEEFGRGEGQYDRFFGDQGMSPNPCLGPIDNAPYYAVRIDLGDLGTKGGLKVDANAQVVDTEDKPIGGLYAVGNCSASPFANCYPGSGGTIGPAMTFAFVAADHISGRWGAAAQAE